MLYTHYQQISTQNIKNENDPPRTSGRPSIMWRDQVREAIQMREGKADADIRPIFMGGQRRMEEALL
jgi:hypothetical protein